MHGSRSGERMRLLKEDCLCLNDAISDVSRSKQAIVKVDLGVPVGVTNQSLRSCKQAQLTCASFSQSASRHILQYHYPANPTISKILVCIFEFEIFKFFS